jgi:hypothetical protein
MLRVFYLEDSCLTLAMSTKLDKKDKMEKIKRNSKIIMISNKQKLGREKNQMRFCSYL